ncbi:glutamyl-tRNA reductase 1 [Abeliophyllum distichum]|uniref:Glutamyl-tRNA reductase 1 n=1 Tax=Abeliophyllum distichum TaxID=126358 RepID=A0ABD1RBG5_9LAMI
MEISKYTHSIQKFSYCYSSSQTRFFKTANIKIREVIPEKQLFECNFCPTPLTGRSRRRSEKSSLLLVNNLVQFFKLQKATEKSSLIFASRSSTATTVPLRRLLLPVKNLPELLEEMDRDKIIIFE